MEKKEENYIEKDMNIHCCIIVYSVFIIPQYSDTVPCKQTVNNQTSTPMKLKNCFRYTPYRGVNRQ